MRLVLLRNRLFLLALAGLMPLAVIAGLSLHALTTHQRARAMSAGIGTARALATAVDVELAASLSTLEALAALAPSDRSGFARYHELLQQVVATQPRWRATKLADANGVTILHTAYPFGATAPLLVDRASFDAVVTTGRSVVGHLVADAGQHYVAARAPVLQGGKVRYVLTAELKPDSILDLIERQNVPADWVVSVFDSANVRVARSRLHDRYIGTGAAPSLAALMARNPNEGFDVTYALEGERIDTAYSRSPVSGWTVAIGVPPALIEAGVYRSRMMFVAGLLLSIAAAAATAVAITRSIVRPMTALSEVARAVGRGRPPQPLKTPIREVREVASVLEASAAELARHERERGELLEREQSARRIAEAANRAKDDFLAMLGHELRNPLGAIANARVILENPTADAAMVAHAKGVIGRQVDHLSRLTDDLLDATRAMTGKIILQKKPLDLAAAVEHVLAALRASGKPLPQRIVEMLEPVWVDGDPTRLEQILTNLVGNAVKYTPPDGLIQISLDREGAEAVLRIVDDGIGMTDDLLPRVFEPFVQGDRALDRSYGGLGLGLTLVRRLAGLHGGTVTVRSDGPNRGSAFTLRLPAIDAPRSEAAIAPTRDAAAPRDILVVDDNEDARDSLQMMFQLDGHRVRVASDAASALEVLRSSPPPEIAIIDIGLPVVDGYELARQITRETPSARRPRLVALTGYGMPSDIERSRAAGFDLHLVKPVEMEALRKVVAS